MKKLIPLILLITSLFTSIQAATCPTVVTRTVVPYIGNYGCWDGTYFWIASFSTSTLFSVKPGGGIASYTNGDALHENFNRVVQLVSHRGYLWLGASNGKLTKFDPITHKSIKSWDLDENIGDGGIQGVISDGYSLWLGIAQYGGGEGSGKVLKFNTTTEAIEMTITAQTNVNGLWYTMYEGKPYILAACDGFWSKINALTGAYTTQASPAGGYRIVSDAKYAYVSAYYMYTVTKYNLSDMAVVATWNTGEAPNCVADFSGYIWTAGDGNAVTIHNKLTGAIVCTMPSAGRSDLVPGNATTMWSVYANVYDASQSEVIEFTTLLGNPTLTSTPTESATASPYLTYTRTKTATQTSTYTNTYTITPTHTATSSLTYTLTPTLYPSNVPTLTSTGTYTCTDTHTVSPTNTPIYTRTNTPTATSTVPTSTITETPAETATFTATPTVTPIPTNFIINLYTYHSDVFLEWVKYPDEYGAHQLNYYILTYGAYTVTLYNSDNLSPSPTRYVYQLTDLGYTLDYDVKVTAYVWSNYTESFTAYPSGTITFSPSDFPGFNGCP